MTKSWDDENIRKSRMVGIYQSWDNQTRRENQSSWALEKFHGGCWYGNVTYYDGPQYCEKFNEPFKERVRTFWDNTCVECGKKETTMKHCVHHVFYIKSACCMRTDDGIYHTNLNVKDHIGNDYLVGSNPNYFIILCMSCHGKTNHKFENRKKYANKYRKLIDEEYGGKSYYTKEEFENFN
jgi:hypothetical protein